MSKFMSVYGIYDVKKQCFASLYFGENDAVFERDFYASVLSAKDSLLFKFPHDFELFCIVDLNTDTGKVMDPIEKYSLGTIYDIMNKFEEVKNEN